MEFCDFYFKRIFLILIATIWSANNTNAVQMQVASHSPQKHTKLQKAKYRNLDICQKNNKKSIPMCKRKKTADTLEKKKKDGRQISVAKITHHPSRSFPSLSACVRLHSQGGGIQRNINLKNAQKGVQKNFFVLTPSLLPQWLLHILALTKAVYCRWQRRERNRGFLFPRHPPLPGLQVQTFSVS